MKKNRCWKGYKPVKGKRAYSKGSCRISNRTARAMARDLRGNPSKEILSQKKELVRIASEVALNIINHFGPSYEGGYVGVANSDLLPRSIRAVIDTMAQPFDAPNAKNKIIYYPKSYDVKEWQEGGNLGNHIWFGQTDRGHDEVIRKGIAIAKAGNVFKNRRRGLRGNPYITKDDGQRVLYGYAKDDIQLLGTGLKISKGDLVLLTPATNIPGGGYFARPGYPTGIWKQISEDNSIYISLRDFANGITYKKPVFGSKSFKRMIRANSGGRYQVGGGYQTFTLEEAKKEADKILRETGAIVSITEHTPTPQVEPDYKYGIYTGRGIARKGVVAEEKDRFFVKYGLTPEQARAKFFAMIGSSFEEARKLSFEEKVKLKDKYEVFKTKLSIAKRKMDRRGLVGNPMRDGVYASGDGFDIKDFSANSRGELPKIQMHPATDLWMRGARFGKVLKVGRKNLLVKLDKLNRPVMVSPRNIGEILE